MTEEYEYGPWIGWNGGEKPPLPDLYVEIILIGGLGALKREIMQSRFVVWNRGNVIAYRIATPKPKRELVVGKWYRTTWRGEWFQCIFPEPEDAGGYFRRDRGDPDAEWFNDEDVDWSTPPRDEAPDE